MQTKHYFLEMVNQFGLRVGPGEENQSCCLRKHLWNEEKNAVSRGPEMGKTKVNLLVQIGRYIEENDLPKITNLFLVASLDYNLLISMTQPISPEYDI